MKLIVNLCHLIFLCTKSTHKSNGIRVIHIAVGPLINYVLFAPIANFFGRFSLIVKQFYRNMRSTVIILYSRYGLCKIPPFLKLICKIIIFEPPTWLAHWTGFIVSNSLTKETHTKHSVVTNRVLTYL